MSYNNQPTVLLHSSAPSMSFSGMAEQLDSIQTQTTGNQNSQTSLKKRRFASLYQSCSSDDDAISVTSINDSGDSMSLDTDLTLEFSDDYTQSQKKRRISRDNSQDSVSQNNGLLSSNSLKFSAASSSSHDHEHHGHGHGNSVVHLAQLDHVSSYSSSDDDDLRVSSPEADHGLPLESSEDDDDDDANTVYSELSTATSSSFMSLSSSNYDAHHDDSMVGESFHLSQFADVIHNGVTSQQFKDLQEKTGCKSFFKRFGGFDISGKNKTNAAQNRHGIPCYDGNRVILHERSPDSHASASDNQFINASFIDSVSQTHRYIATQAPLKSTTHKFWEMVFQENSHLIVCLADTDDSSQADQYWPKKINESLQYGDRITVTLVDEHRVGQSNITKRTHLVRKFDPTGASDIVQESTVQQLHYHGWADMTAPANVRTMFLLMEEIEQIELALAENGRALGPVVVHCSAGIGRAGTFIAAHIACEFVVAMEENRGIKVQDFNLMQLVYELRQQRPLMVYKQEQYDALHQIVHLFCTGEMLEI